ncbi:ABC transporter permease [Paracoccus binzhouensis]|uniref:ABC transporter permease n=1 Tax=Paracoccus binzhouensis TaxID=2796149 RepID=UPI0018EEF866|nr:ABC transporter permease [Paracoccus binzhouensis]
MNPVPFVRALLARNPRTIRLFAALVALAAALGIAVSAQERALRQGSARAADRFDLIVAAPGSQTDLLMSAVFLRPTQVELLPGPLAHRVLSDRDAEFAAPLAFGDSHGDSPVIGTTADFVAHLSGGLAEGRGFARIDEAVVGALVEGEIGAALAIRHGHADDVAAGLDADHAAEAHEHEHHHDHGHDHAAEDGHHEDGHHHEDVVITGRMRPTGTPWDRAVVVPVEYIWSAHVMGTGHPPGDERIGPPWQAELMPGLPAIVMKPASVADAYGLRARYRTEASTAFFPAETLIELYAVMGDATRVMLGLTLAAQVLIVAAILAGILAVLDLQRRSFAVLRALGAPRRYVFLSVWLYVAVMVLGGALAGLPLGWAASQLVSALISRETGVAFAATLGWSELAMAGLLVLAGFLLALLPAWRVYRQPVVEGLR